MQILLKSAGIIDRDSPYHGQIKDIFIQDGKIESIGEQLQVPLGSQIIEIEGLKVSRGWFDSQVYVADPGEEHREDILSISKASAAGGFTTIAMMPNTDPPLHSKTEIEYILNKSAGLITSILPVGALSKNTAGKELTEMQDMFETGAVAFSDGYKPVKNIGLLKNALLYAKSINGVILVHPEDHDMSGSGLVHEGMSSLLMGVDGLPSESEIMTIERDLQLLEYCGSRLHFLNVSTAASVEKIRKAKAAGLSVTASVNAYNLLLEDSEVLEFDSLYKVNPPLRSSADRMSLLEGLADGTIDMICSGHLPQDSESKEVEFDMAAFGISYIECAFSVARQASKEIISIERLIECFTTGPAGVFGEYCYPISEGYPACLTLFKDHEEWVPEWGQMHSKSKYNPFIGRSLWGRALGIIHKKKSYFPAY